MTQFFSNPLSIFLDTTTTLAFSQVELYEAVRNLPSFRRFVEICSAMYLAGLKI